MSSAEGLYQERLKRIHQAVKLEKPDKTPLLFNGEPFCGRMNGVKLKDFCFNSMDAFEKAFEGFKALGDIDAVELVGNYPQVLGPFWLSKMKLPGRELREDELWQVDEIGIMSVDDYDTIISKGWNNFFADCLTNRLDNGLDHFKTAGEYAPQVAKMYNDAGVVIYSSPFFTQVPLESFFPGRGIKEMTKDLYKIPDKVEEAMKVAHAEIVGDVRQMTRAIRPNAVFLGGTRGNTAFTSKKIFLRFVLPYLKELVQAIADEDNQVLLHFDGNWDYDFEYFKDFPKNKCVLALDGSSDIFKAKEVLGDHMCIMGDVPPGLLALGTAEEVYNYSTKLIREIGPSGFILAAGCMVPVNSKIENVKAMIAAASGK